MKILYIITKSNWGGAQKHVYDLAVSMKERGHTVVIGLGGDGELRTRLGDAGIKTYSISGLARDIKVSADAGSFKEIYSLIRHEKPDVLHLHSPKAAGLGALAGRLLRVKKIIYTVHGWSFNEDRSLWQRSLIALASWITVALSHTTIVLSERELKQALLFPGVKDRLVLVPPGLKQPVFMSIDGAKQIIAKHVGLSLADLGKRVMIGTIAELHKNKGLTYFVEALADVCRVHPNVLAVIIGGGEERLRLQTLIGEKKLENNVRLLGYMENAAENIKAFNMFVLPSVKEGLPYVLLEAGFGSQPVIATTVGGVPEIVEDMKSGVLVQPKNERELAHAIAFMIEHPHMRRQYGAALREHVLQKYGFEKLIARVAALYAEA